FKAHHNLNTLLDFRYKKKYKADNGDAGGTSLKDGKKGEDIIINVPIGTLIKDFETGETLFDFDKDKKQVTLAKGGKGGKGNSNFATPTNRAPRYAEPGKPGQYSKIVLELKLIADVGLVGFPNAGKSTLISKVSAARPKIADYPFTTLEPNLGIVNYKEYRSFTMADIPGIIEGAHKGKGLGHKFLRHIERTRILLVIIEITSENYGEDFKVLMGELKNFSARLINKKIIVSFSKSDLVDEESINKSSKYKFDREINEPLVFSSVTGFGIKKLLNVLWKTLEEEDE
ncbi:MAG: GTPase ObgE, partial [Ignavibacteriaceae bacterium]|nr:GTPase ObgE [Ignavibacteriaceae bacterium]